MLLSDADIEHLQRVSCLNAVASNGTVFSDRSSNDKFLQVVTYRQLVSVVRQCENVAKSLSSTGENLFSNSGKALQKKFYNCTKAKRQPTVSALRKLPIHECGKFGH